MFLVCQVRALNYILLQPAGVLGPFFFFQSRMCFSYTAKRELIFNSMQLSEIFGILLSFWTVTEHLNKENLMHYLFSYSVSFP